MLVYTSSKPSWNGFRSKLKVWPDAATYISIWRTMWDDWSAQLRTLDDIAGFESGSASAHASTAPPAQCLLSMPHSPVRLQGLRTRIGQELQLALLREDVDQALRKARCEGKFWHAYVYMYILTYRHTYAHVFWFCHLSSCIHVYSLSTLLWAMLDSARHFIGIVMLIGSDSAGCQLTRQCSLNADC